MSERPRRARSLVVASVIVTSLVLGVTPWASDAPDGLDKVAAERGFSGTAEEHPLEDGPLAGYSVRGIEGDRLSTGLSGAIGAALTFVVALVAFTVVRRVRRREGDES